MNKMRLGLTNGGLSRRAALAGLALAPCVARAQPAPIRVGGTLPLTGPLASIGAVHKIAAEAFVAEANQAGGVLGRKLEWVLLDDQSQASGTRTLYEKLVTSEKVDLLMGPYGTSSILAAMGVAARYGKLFIQSSLGDPTLATYDRQFPALPLGPNPKLTDSEVLFDAWAATPTPPRTVAIVTSKFPSTLDLAGGARQVAAQRGLAVPLYLEYEFGTRDFGAIAARVKDAGADLLWMGCIGLEGSQFLEAAKRLDYAPPRQFYLFPATGPLAANPAAEGATSLTWFEGHAPFTANAGAAAFIAAYDGRARAASLAWPHVDYQAAAEFAAWQILAAAITATGGTDDKAMAAWLKANAVPTVLGRQSFEGKNNSGPAKTLVRQLQGGQWVAVFPEPFRPPGGAFHAA